MTDVGQEFTFDPIGFFCGLFGFPQIVQGAVTAQHQPDEECKKPHWHVMFYSGHGPITLAAAKAAIPEGVPANGYIEPAHSPQGSQRYLIHLDDPEKQQWVADQAKAGVFDGVDTKNDPWQAYADRLLAQRPR